MNPPTIQNDTGNKLPSRAASPAQRRVFGRLGTISTVRAQARQVEQFIHGRVAWDKEAGTCVATLGSHEAFRALDKGDGTWLVMYSTEFYPKGGK